MPNQIGQAYGLTVLSPLVPGNDASGKSHVEAARAYVLGIEASGTSPFAKIGGATPTTHTARWVLLDQVADEGGHFHDDQLLSKYLLLDVNLDTDARGLDGFIADMVDAMPAEIVELYSHCVGFTGLGDFAEYIKRCQLETTFFFVDYASEERGKVVHVKRALDIQREFVALALGVENEPPKAARQRIEAFMARLEWTPPKGQVVHHAATAPARPSKSQRVELTDVQGNVLRGYKHPFARHLYFRVLDASTAKDGLRALSSQVDHSGHWGPEKPKSMLNLAFSWKGLEALGIPRRTLDGFPLAFRMGMLARAEILGDSDSSDPDRWERQEGKELWKEGVHVLASIHASSEAILAEETKWVVATLGAGVRLVGEQDAAELRLDGRLGKTEHFGFVDGLGTTDIESPGLDNTPGSGKLDEHGQWTGLAPGELLFGYFDEANELPDAPNPPDWVRNGTFLVYRKLEEHVTRFRAYLKEHGARYDGGEELLAAKIVGRFRDGTPLALSAEPDATLVRDPHRNNDFRYGDDPDGAKCPVGAHIRRSRPRDALGFAGKVTDRRRLQRRGMPYGPPLPEGSPGDGRERGIIFMAYAIDIERQFEFVQQQWLNYGNSFRQGNDKDILTGNHDGTGKAVVQATSGGAPFFCASLPRFVDMRGGEYFFVPGIAGLRKISGG